MIRGRQSPLILTEMDSEQIALARHRNLGQKVAQKTARMRLLDACYLLRSTGRHDLTALVPALRTKVYDVI